MEINEFLGKLEGVTADGKGGWMACCPAHDDRNPSMHVNVGDDGRILVKCFAGCSSDEIVSAMGLKKRDLMGKDRLAQGGKGARVQGAARAQGSNKRGATAAHTEKKRDFGKLVCEYVYRLEDGAAVYKVQRRVMANGKKTFIQMSPDPNDPTKWVFGVAGQGVEYIPYQLPLIRKAAERGAPVIVVEGEKDVETAVRTLRMAATCNPKGAGKWQSGWGKYFEGVPSVLIIADKDPLTKKDPKTGEDKLFAVGQRHACDVERKLRADGYEGKIRKIALPDVGEAHVKDFTDWVEAMGAEGREVGKSALKEAITAFGEWPKEWEFDGAEEAQIARRDGRAPRDDEDARRDGRAPRDDEDGGGWVERGSVSRYGEEFTDGDGKRGYRAVVNGYIRIEVRRGDNLAQAIFASIAEVKRKLGEGARMSAEVRRDTESMTVLLWLRCRGTFFYDEENEHRTTAFYFDRQKGKLYSIPADRNDAGGTQFRAWLATESYINQETPNFRHLISLLRDAGITDGVSSGIVPAKLWCRRGGKVYISSGDSEMYRVSASGVEKVQNGQDNVVFLSRATLTPWEYKGRGNGADPFAEAMIFKSASFRSEADRMTLRLWFLNALYDHAQKPPLLVTGCYGSGKTRTGLALKEIVGTTDRTVQQIEDGDKGCEAFWVITNAGKLEVFDNFDQKIKWTNDAIQVAATNGAVKRRTLYTTGGMTTLKANAWLILTSNNPQFAAEAGSGLADRLQIVRLEQATRQTVDTALGEDIARNRDRFLTWAADSISAALADTGELPPPCNRRHPDYADFSVRLGRAGGYEEAAIAALTEAELEKSVLPLRNAAIAKEIVCALLRRGGVWKFTAKEMSEDILAHIEDSDEKTASIYSARKIGKALSGFSSQINTVFQIATDETGAPRSPRLLQGTTIYEYTGIKVSEAVLGGFMVGQVDIKPVFLSSRTETISKESYIDSHLIPTLPTSNPPNSSLKEEGKGGGNKEINDIFDDLDTEVFDL